MFTVVIIVVIVRDHLSEDIRKGSIKCIVSDSYKTQNLGEKTQKNDKKVEKLPIEKRVSNALTAGFYMNAAMKCTSDSVYKTIPLGCCYYYYICNIVVIVVFSWFERK